MKQTPISARINTNVLEYIKGCHEPINSLINTLLKKWMKERQNKELLLFQEETGTDEFSQLAERHTERSSQCCINCKYDKGNLLMFNCEKTGILNNLQDRYNFCCVYWEKKKERK